MWSPVSWDLVTLWKKENVCSVGYLAFLGNWTFRQLGGKKGGKNPEKSLNGWKFQQIAEYLTILLASKAKTFCAFILLLPCWSRINLTKLFKQRISLTWMTLTTGHWVLQRQRAQVYFCLLLTHLTLVCYMFCWTHKACAYSLLAPLTFEWIDLKLFLLLFP